MNNNSENIKLEEVFDMKLSMLHNLDTNIIIDNYGIQALISKDYSDKFNMDSANLNKIRNQDSLATVGDKILGSIVATHLYRIHEDEGIDKGGLSKLIFPYIKNSNLDNLGRIYRINEMMILGKDEKIGKRKIATTVEAIIGAIYFSAGYVACQNFVINTLKIFEIKPI